MFEFTLHALKGFAEVPCLLINLNRLCLWLVNFISVTRCFPPITAAVIRQRNLDSFQTACVYIRDSDFLTESPASGNQWTRRCSRLHKIILPYLSVGRQELKRSWIVRPALLSVFSLFTIPVGSGSDVFK